MREEVHKFQLLEAVGWATMDQEEPRHHPVGPSLDSLRLMQSVFGMDEDTNPSNKRQVPGSSDNSLSGSITEQLHFEPIAPLGPVESSNIDKVDVSQLGDQNLAIDRIPDQVTLDVDQGRVCKRCERGPSYHHGHDKHCPKSHFAKKQKREASLEQADTSETTCRRCIIGPSYHKAHARNCPRSKYYQQTIRDTRGRKRQGDA